MLGHAFENSLGDFDILDMLLIIQELIVQGRVESTQNKVPVVLVLHEALDAYHRSAAVSPLAEASLQEYIAFKDAQLAFKAGTSGDVTSGHVRFPAGSVQFIEAFLLLVDAKFGIPLDSELEVWTKHLIQGKTNALQPNVRPEETPEEFADRVWELKLLFARYPEHSSIKDVLASHSYTWVLERKRKRKITLLRQPRGA